MKYTQALKHTYVNSVMGYSYRKPIKQVGDEGSKLIVAAQTDK